MQEAKELKDAAKRAGKKAKEDFKQREADMQQRHARELAAADAVAPSAENGAGDEEAPVAQEESAAGRTGGGGKVRMPTSRVLHCSCRCMVSLARAPCVRVKYAPQGRSDTGASAADSKSCAEQAGRRHPLGPQSA